MKTQFSVFIISAGCELKAILFTRNKGFFFGGGGGRESFQMHLASSGLPAPGLCV